MSEKGKVVTPAPPGLINKEDIPQVLPILPLRNSVFFPGGVLPLAVGRQKTIALIKDAVRDDQVRGARVLLLRLALGDDADHLVDADRVLDQGDGLLPTHGQRKHPAGDEHAVAQRKDGEDRRDVLLVDQARGCRGDDFAFLGHSLVLPVLLRNLVPRV